MVMNIGDALSAYKQIGNLATQGGVKTAGTEAGGSFGDLLKSIGQDTVESLRAGEQATIAGAQGKANLTEVIIAVSNAEMTLQTVTSIRDKLVSAYQEIMRMGV